MRSSLKLKLKGEWAAFAPVNRNPLQWSFRLVILPAFVLLVSPGFRPRRANGQIYLPRYSALLCYRRYQQIRTKHELVRQVGGIRVSGKVEVQWAHGRGSVDVRCLVKAAQVRPKLFAQVK